MFAPLVQFYSEAKSPKRRPMDVAEAAQQTEHVGHILAFIAALEQQKVCCDVFCSNDSNPNELKLNLAGGRCDQHPHRAPRVSRAASVFSRLALLPRPACASGLDIFIPCAHYYPFQSLRVLASLHLSPNIEHLDFARLRDTTVLYTVFPNLLEEFVSMSYADEVK